MQALDFVTAPNLALVVLALAVIGYIIGRVRAVAASKGDPSSLHSRPGYHAAFVFIWTGLPALVVLAAWVVLQPFYVEPKGYEVFPKSVMESTTQPADLKMDVVKSIAKALEDFSPEQREKLVLGFRDIESALDRAGVAVAEIDQSYMPRAAQVIFETRQSLKPIMAAVVLGLAVIGFIFSIAVVSRRMRARNRVETAVRGMLIIASSIAILTTFGIVFALIFDTIRFFSVVPFQDFLFGLTWDPTFQGADEEGHSVDSRGFGFVPLIFGTVYISFIALLVAVPIGLFSAIYMAEFATPRFRSIAKPVLEVLAGVPTIVYGFFALVTVGPALAEFFTNTLGLEAQGRSVLTAGIVMGIMIIPFVSSLSDDIITAVPQSLRDASLGLGATKAETVRIVLLPAALPGIMAAVLLAASRAIGETMIVVLAAGATAQITANPLEAMTTITVTIVNLLKADTDFTSPQALSAYALGITLFVVTLVMNVYALRIVRKYREQYE
ncbi:MAG: phosphate ABC transporter permease subunit PstC [Neomegalonema sp.]|nr:phosphate ABC transporter permease subunit PstC [Neomegalonema sp.]